jgi:hypothetical protein
VTPAPPDRLAEAFRHASGGDRFAAHPEPEVFERFALRELAADERAAFLDHTVACPECAPLLRAVEALRRERSDGNSALDRPASRAGIGRPARWFLAAATGLAAVLALVVLRPSGEGVEGPGELRAHGTPGLEALEPRGHLAAAPLLVRWEPLAVAPTSVAPSPANPSAGGLVSYRVIVVRGDGASVAEVLVAAPGATSAPWPEAARPRGHYVWSVEALRDGERVARSPLVDVDW